ncbi:MAG TPA: hypothetical protein VME92_05715 [Acetobacteraceae bacterium]|nr:hypothetical protein [Acetobacteraceae bacterium]
MAQDAIIRHFALVAARYGAGRGAAESWRAPESEWQELFACFFRHQAGDGWALQASSYTSLIELALQSLVHRFLRDPPPLLRPFEPLPPEQVCVRFLRVPGFVAEFVPSGGFHYIVLSEAAYAFPLHVGFSLDFLSRLAGPDRLDLVPSNFVGGSDAATAIETRRALALPILGSLLASGMSAVTRGPPDGATGAEMLRGIDMQNQRGFVQGMIAITRMGGGGPFDDGIADAVAYFPIAFAIYALFHELGHLVYRHKTGLRDLGEEVVCDWLAAAAIEHCFGVVGYRVPLASAAAAIFYAILKYLAMLNGRLQLGREETPDASSYTALGGRVVHDGKVVTDSDAGALHEMSLIDARLATTARLLGRIGYDVPLRQRDYIATFWSMFAETQIPCIASLLALDPQASDPSRSAEVAFWNKFKLGLRSRTQERIAASRVIPGLDDPTAP